MWGIRRDLEKRHHWCFDLCFDFLSFPISEHKVSYWTVYIFLNVYFSGRMIEAVESNHLSFRYFLSDQDNIQNNGVGGTLSQSTDFTGSSESLLSGMQVDDTNYMVEGTTEIQVHYHMFAAVRIRWVELFWPIRHTCQWANAIILCPLLSSSAVATSVYGCSSDHRNFTSCTYLHIYMSLVYVHETLGQYDTHNITHYTQNTQHQYTCKHTCTHIISEHFC